MKYFLVGIKTFINQSQGGGKKKSTGPSGSQLFGAPDPPPGLHNPQASAVSKLGVTTFLNPTGAPPAALQALGPPGSGPVPVKKRFP